MTIEPTIRRPIGTRRCVFVVFMSAMAPLMLITCLAFGVSVAGGVLLFGCVLLLAIPVIMPGDAEAPPRDRARHRFFLVLWIAASLYASYQVGRLGVFMLDADRTEYAISPSARPLDDSRLAQSFFAKHNCFTSYVIGAHLAAEGAENIYLPDHYRDSAHPTEIHTTIGDTLTIDRYQYPPPFLILPRLMLAVGGDFFGARTYWFVLNVLAFCGAVGALAVWLGGREFHAYWLLWPIVLAAPTTIATLQIGNFHFLVIALSITGMLALETKRNLLGGALLGFAIVAKIFPGVLLAYLLLRKRFAAVAWTCAGMVVFTGAAVLIFSWQPFDAFIHYQLGRLASGEAFSFATEKIRAILVNSSVMGAAYKLNELGWLFGANPEAVAKFLVWAHTALIGGVVILLGLRHRHLCGLTEAGERGANDRLVLARTWLVLLTLAQLRSPFLPWGYGNVAVLWLLALMIPDGTKWLRGTIVLMPIWLMFATYLPLPVGPPTMATDLLFGLSAQLVTLILCVGVVIRPVRANAD